MDPTELATEIAGLEKQIDDKMMDLMCLLGDRIAKQAQALSRRYPRREIEVAYCNGSFSVTVQAWPKRSMFQEWGLWIDFRGEWETCGPDPLIPHLEAMAVEWLTIREIVEHRCHPMIDYPVTFLAGQPANRNP